MDKLIINEMLSNCVHLGHKINLLNPHMEKYIINSKYNINIINLEKTYYMFNKALKIIKNLTKFNKTILIVCTKKKSRKIIELAAKNINMPYVNNRWLGGTLTNFETLKNSLNSMNYINNLLKNKKTLKFKKKLVNIYYKKLKRIKKFWNGVKNLDNLPDLLFVIDCNRHKIAISEAIKMKIPIIAVADTNNNISNIDYLIPGNDDSCKSINFFMRKITETINITKKNIIKNLNKNL